MKRIKYSIIPFLLMFWQLFCQSQSIEIIFETSQNDTATRLGEPKIYILKKQAINADFNYTKLEDMYSCIKDTLNIRNVMPVFEPINGQFNYYQFLATFKGECYMESWDTLVIKDFHDILIIKTDRNNKIIDAFQYTLEWAEMPIQYDLFRSSTNDIILINNLDIKQLKFMRTYDWNDEDGELLENGIIKLN